MWPELPQYLAYVFYAWAATLYLLNIIQAIDSIVNDRRQLADFRWSLALLIIGIFFSFLSEGLAKL